MRARAGEVDATLWLQVDSFSLLQALASLAARLADEYDIQLVELRLSRASGQRAHLDLVWTGPSMSTETVLNWEAEPMRIGAESSPLSVRDVVQRHGGEFWFERERVRHQTFFRFLLPLAGAQEQLDPASLAARRQPPGVLRLRPVPGLGIDPRARRAAAGRAGLHRVRHRDHRA